MSTGSLGVGGRLLSCFIDVEGVAFMFFKFVNIPRSACRRTFHDQLRASSAQLWSGKRLIASSARDAASPGILTASDCERLSRWGGIVKNMNLALGKGFSACALRERLDLLMAQFLANDCASLRKSGTEEEYEEKERLLQEISSLARDFGYKIKSRKAQPSAGQRVSGVVTRDTAAAMLAPASQVTFEPLSADASFEDTSQSAEDLLERISQGTNIAATPGLSDETTTTANNQRQEASTNAEDRPDTEGAAQVVPRRRRAKAAMAGADSEFFEKRWRHERALKEKEHALEMDPSQREQLSRSHKATQDVILEVVETICDKLAK
ncbi:hypothetical protein MRX96_026804 [Rhipicephalus microplus]